MASDDNDLLIFTAAGLLGYYFWQKSKADAFSQQQQSYLIPTPIAPESEGMTIEHYMDAPSATDMIAPAAGKITEILAKLAPIPIVGQIAPIIGASVMVEAQALTEIISEGNLSTGNILTTAALFFPPTWIFIGLGKLLHIDLFGQDLDSVNKVLLTPFSSPITRDNTQSGMPIYFLDGDKILHHITEPSLLHKAGFSWRSVIAVPQEEIDFFPIGGPLLHVADEKEPAPPGVTPTPISFAERPATPEGIRAYFGRTAIFKVGSSNDLYGPYDGMNRPPAGCCTPLPGSPYEAYLAKISVRASRAGF